MPDREKVIKHIVDCINAVDGLTNVQWVLAELDVLKAALTLLKEREPVEPIRKVIGCGWRYFCGKCGNSIAEQQRFYEKCGQAVKWE